jgi:fumarate reductase flavoprotein subunit
MPEWKVMGILKPKDASFDVSVDIVVVGAGACGYTASLAARDVGADVVIIERDSTPLGSTAMSTGLIPAAGTRFQRERGINDSPDIFANDILKKAKQKTDVNVVRALARESAPTVHWLVDNHDIPLSLVKSFLYPGHSVMRVHGTPNRSGTELMAALGTAGERAQVDVLTSATATELFASGDGTIRGVRVTRPDGSREDIGCGALILACCGFAGNKAMLSEFIPEMAQAEFFGHPGNKGDAIRWGQALGASVVDLGAYQGHGGLAVGHAIPILWPLIMEGGIQVNKNAQRFSNEAMGYSEQAAIVIAQPDNVAYDIFDERLHQLMLEFQDYRDAVEAGAITSAPSVSALAESLRIPADALEATLDNVARIVRGEEECPFGRRFKENPILEAPFYAAKVKGALFHTQGGLAVDTRARVLRKNGKAFPNLYAGGGAARGVSGPGGWGYLAGNGLLTATTFGRLAGETAASVVRSVAKSAAKPA